MAWSSAGHASGCWLFFCLKPVFCTNWCPTSFIFQRCSLASSFMTLSVSFWYILVFISWTNCSRVAKWWQGITMLLHVFLLHALAFSYLFIDDTPGYGQLLLGVVPCGHASPAMVVLWSYSCGWRVLLSCVTTLLLVQSFLVLYFDILSTSWVFPVTYHVIHLRLCDPQAVFHVVSAVFLLRQLPVLSFLIDHDCMEGFVWFIFLRLCCPCSDRW